MYGQALRLKQIIDEKNNKNKNAAPAKVISISSGKGGVGKTNISVNLGLALQKLGKKVLIVDADLGLANVDIITGLTAKYNISHIIDSPDNIHGIHDIILDGPLGLKILPGASGLYEIANMSNEELAQIIVAFTEISNAFDIMLIDTGAGISSQVLSFIRTSDEAILVTTPEPSAITDAYVTIKLIYQFVNKVSVIVNRVNDFREADNAFQKLSRTTQKFLNTEIDYLGYVLEDKTVIYSNIKQVPFFIYAPNSLVSKCILTISNKLLYGEQTVERQNNGNSWFRKFISFIKKGQGG